MFYEDDTCLYNSAQEATKDMVKRGLSVKIFKPPTSWADRVKELMWQRYQSPSEGEQQTGVSGMASRRNWMPSDAQTDELGVYRYSILSFVNGKET